MSIIEETELSCKCGAKFDLHHDKRNNCLICVSCLIAERDAAIAGSRSIRDMLDGTNRANNRLSADNKDLIAANSSFVIAHEKLTKENNELKKGRDAINKMWKAILEAVPDVLTHASSRFSIEKSL